MAVAALMTACTVFGPLYERAMQQALAGVKVDEAQIQVRGLTVGTQGRKPLDDGQLAALLPEELDRYFADPVPLHSVEVTYGTAQGTLISKPGICSHLTFRSGDCPDQAGEVAISAATAGVYGWRPGKRLALAESKIDGEEPPFGELKATIVGVYDVRGGDYWFGRTITGQTGAPNDNETGKAPIDDVITDESAFADDVTEGDAAAPGWVGARTDLSFSLEQEKVRIDDLQLLGKRLDALNTQLIQDMSTARWGDFTGVTLTTGLPGIADEVEHGDEQARVVVPLLMGQLALLTLVVLWLVLGAAVAQRRPEVALAQLRGRGARGAGWWLLRELLPLVVLGFVAGCAGAVGLSWVARHLTLPATPPAERPADALIAAAAALAVLLATTGLAVLRVAREPVISLLRRVPTRRSGWAVKGFDGMLLSGSLVVVVAFAAGSLTGPMAVVAPALLALSVGIGLAHLLTAAASALGQRLLRRGRYVAAVATAMVARQPSTRQLITIVTVASGLLVFSADALITADRNRADAAAQQNGAAVRAKVDNHDLEGVRRALAEVDPDHDRVTPVVRLSSPGGGATTDAVVPEEYRRIALFPGQSPADMPWADLAAPAAPSLRIAGVRITMRLDAKVQVIPVDDEARVILKYVNDAGEALSATLAELPDGTRRVKVDAHLPCSKGCTVVGLEVVSPLAHSTAGTITLSQVATDQGPVDLGVAADWQPFDDGESTVVTEDRRAGRLALEVTLTEGSSSLVRHAAIPDRIPAVVSGRSAGRGAEFDGLSLGGIDRRMARAGQVPRVPAGDPVTNLVNLDVLSREGTELGDGAIIWLLFADDDPAIVAKVDAALHEQGSSIVSHTTVQQVRHDLDTSAAAWAIELAVLVGVASIGLAGLAMLVIAATTQRRRSFDLAALRMSGVRAGPIRRVALAEQLVVVILAVMVGAACGATGARLAMPDIPMFAVEPKVSTLNLGTAWLAVLVAAAAALAVLTLAGGLVARAAGRRATLLRLRESL